jgi:hypothetical protein
MVNAAVGAGAGAGHLISREEFDRQMAEQRAMVAVLQARQGLDTVAKIGTKVTTVASAHIAKKTSEAVGEVASGAVSCVQEWRETVAGLARHAALVSADASRLCDTASTTVPTPPFTGIIENLREAYACLGIPYEYGTPGPAREEIDIRYRDLQLQYHPDRAIGLGPDMVRRFSNLIVCLNAAKAFIYNHRHWAYWTIAYEG